MEYSPRRAPEMSALARAGLSAVSNADYDVNATQEIFDAEKHLKQLAQKAKTQVASCWGQFYVVSESVREAQAQAQISEMVDKELRKFKQEMARNEREEKERLERVYSAIVKPREPEEFEMPNELNDRMRPLIHSTDILIPADAPLATPRARSPADLFGAFGPRRESPQPRVADEFARADVAPAGPKRVSQWGDSPQRPGTYERGAPGRRGAAPPRPAPAPEPARPAVPAPAAPPADPELAEIRKVYERNVAKLAQLEALYA